MAFVLFHRDSQALVAKIAAALGTDDDAIDGHDGLWVRMNDEAYGSSVLSRIPYLVRLHQASRQPTPRTPGACSFTFGPWQSV